MKTDPKVGICKECLYYDSKLSECRVRSPEAHNCWPKRKSTEWCGEWDPDEGLRKRAENEN